MRSARNNNNNMMTKKNFGVKVDELQEYNHFITHTNKVVYSENRVNNFSSNQGTKVVEENMHGNALRQFLNSVDLRIIKSIEDDTEKLLLSTNPANDQINFTNQTTKQSPFFTTTNK
jgi:hypothetical protein